MKLFQFLVLNAIYAVLFVSCKDKSTDTPISCGSDYIIQGDTCYCEGVIASNNICYSWNRIFQYHGFICDTMSCYREQTGPIPYLTIEPVMDWTAPELAYYKVKFGDYPHEWETTLTPQNSDSAYFNKDPYNGFTQRGHENIVYLERQVEDETQYLRVYLKKLDETVYRVHFVWETYRGTERQRCTRIYHQ